MDSIEFAKTHHSGVFVVANAIQIRTNTQKKTEGFVFIDMGYMHFILLGNHFILFRLNIIFYVCCFCLNRSAAYTFKCPDEKGFCPLCYGKISIVSWVVLISRSLSLHLTVKFQWKKDSTILFLNLFPLLVIITL